MGQACNCIVCCLEDDDHDIFVSKTQNDPLIHVSPDINLTIHFDIADGDTTNATAKINGRNAALAFPLAVEDKKWCWARFVDKAFSSECHGYFRIVDADEEADEHTAIFQMLSAFLHDALEQSLETFPLELGTNICASVQGDDTVYTLEFLRTKDVKPERIFCVIKSPVMCAVVFECPNASVSWRVWDDTSRAFKPLKHDALVEKELHALYYTNMSHWPPLMGLYIPPNRPIFSQCYLRRYSELEKEHYQVRYSAGSEGDNDFVMDLIRYPPTNASSLARVKII